MKILQLNAIYKERSTGRIASELHEFFKENRIDSYVGCAVVPRECKKDQHIFEIGNNIGRKIHAIAYRLDHLQGMHSTFSTKKLLSQIERIDPDMIMLHNMHSNYVNIKLLIEGIQRLGIPILIVLHDCWFYTGGCYHYTNNKCYQWMNGCRKCELYGGAARKKYVINYELMKKSKPNIIAISKWLESEANKSMLNEFCDIKQIYNWIDLKTFYPRKNNDIRKKLEIDSEIIVLGIAVGWNKNKGLDEMILLAQSLPNIKVILVGNHYYKEKYPQNIIALDYVSDKNYLAELYSQADIFVNLSKQETFGLVSAEALACGTPLIVYDSTACPEFINEYTGKKISNKSEIVDAVQYIIDLKARKGDVFIQKKCREYAEKHFNMSIQLKKYLNYIEDICNRERN